jgi:glycosyltransferase involved in cell wall biosynthesis
LERFVNQPHVSVIIPTYNRKRFLIDAVRSVLDGSYGDFELIVIDDGSTDGTERALGAFDGRIEYRYQPNRGVSSARNLGVSLSSAEYIAFLDSDDLWTERKLEKQMQYMADHPALRACHTDETWLRDGIHLNQGKRHRKYGGHIFERCLPLCIISPSTILLEKTLFEELGGFDERLPACEDYDLWLRMTLRCEIGYIPEPLVVKRGGHPDQLSRAYWGMDRFRIRALAGLIAHGEVDGEKKIAVLEELERKCRIVSKGMKKRGRAEEAESYRSLPARLLEEKRAFPRGREDDLSAMIPDPEVS